MTNDIVYIEILNRSISESEEKLQEAVKNDRQGNGVENIKIVLK